MGAELNSDVAIITPINGSAVAIKFLGLAPTKTPRKPVTRRAG